VGDPVSARATSALMLQGTGSHAGKTVLAAGLCRLLARAGLRVLPFKAQNMSNNAWVTDDGEEIGWAQAMQAEAAGAVPRVDMNPVLLKPESGHRCQVIRLGRPLATVSPREYAGLAERLWPAITASYARLVGAADVVVIEGAGSPAEPNLMRRDLANMRVARLARARVLIVGDIDRGGVFAALTGTMALLPSADRRLVSGFILNKFRGDPSLLGRAPAELRRRTGKPVLGVVPFLPGLALPEEDSLGLEHPRAGGAAPGDLRIAVIRLPSIANATDLAPLASEPGVALFYAERPAELVDADLLVLPGSKDTLADLRHLVAGGFAPLIRAHVAEGRAVLGICGGYQMLGERVEDPDRVESGGAAPGLALLPVTTRLQAPKTSRRVRARWLPHGPAFDGYEIHGGATVAAPGARALGEVQGQPVGTAAAAGRVWGLYVHGLFESAASRRHVLTWAGAPPERGGTGDHRAVREAAYDRLADALEGAVGSKVFQRLLRR
jgi:adenosylcobyric acid synthase